MLALLFRRFGGLTYAPSTRARPRPKGIWLAPALTSPLRLPSSYSTLTEPHTQDLSLALARPLPPYLTLIGSSNYGNRSASRDLEANLLVTTDARGLQKQLGGELKGLREFAKEEVGERLFKRRERRVPWGVRVAAGVIEDML